MYMFITDDTIFSNLLTSSTKRKGEATLVHIFFTSLWINKTSILSSIFKNGNIVKKRGGKKQKHVHYNNKGGVLSTHLQNKAMIRQLVYYHHFWPGKLCSTQQYIGQLMHKFTNPSQILVFVFCNSVKMYYKCI